MEHRLARAWAYVQDRSITVLDFALARYLRGSEVTASDNLGIGSLCFFQTREVTLRKDQDVRWSLGIDVFEGEDVLIFVDFFGRNFAANDTAKEAVWIGHLYLPE